LSDFDPAALTLPERQEYGQSSRSDEGRVAIVIVTWQRDAVAATMSGLNAASSRL
jgi:hypothetical protein